MLAIYILLITLAAFPLALTIWRMQVGAKIKKNDINTNGLVTNINTIQAAKGGALMILTGI